MKQGDVGTKLVFTIKDENGNPVDLTTAKNVYLVMRLGNTQLEKTCSVVDAPAGVVEYEVQVGDLSKPGILYMEIRVEFMDGDIYTSSRVKTQVESKL